jgi:ferritin-like metal-binding protein YciE
MKLQTLKDLRAHELKPLYSAEQQRLEALPTMAQATANAQLAAAFQVHLEQTRKQPNRLETLLQNHDQSARDPRYKGMEGVLAEGAELLDAEAEEGVRDAGLSAAAQRVEPYAIAGYGSARTYAEMLGDAAGAIASGHAHRGNRDRPEAYRPGQVGDQPGRHQVTWRFDRGVLSLLTVWSGPPTSIGLQ